MLSEAYQGESWYSLKTSSKGRSASTASLKDSGIFDQRDVHLHLLLSGERLQQALHQVHEQFAPDRIIIEPPASASFPTLSWRWRTPFGTKPDMKLEFLRHRGRRRKVKVYMKNFGGFYNNQIESAGTIIPLPDTELSQEAGGRRGSLCGKNLTAAILTPPRGPAGRPGCHALSAVERSLADELLAKMRAEHEAEEAESTTITTMMSMMTMLGMRHHHHHDHDERRAVLLCHHHDDDEMTTNMSITIITRAAAAMTMTTKRDHHHDHDEHEHHHHQRRRRKCDDPSAHHTTITPPPTRCSPAGAPRGQSHSYTEEDIRRILTALDTGDYGAILRQGSSPAAASGCTRLCPEESRTSATAAPTTTGRLCHRRPAEGGQAQRAVQPGNTCASEELWIFLLISSIRQTEPSTVSPPGRLFAGRTAPC